MFMSMAWYGRGGRGAKKIAHCIDNGWYSLYYKKRHLPCVEYMGKYPCVTIHNIYRVVP